MTEILADVSIRDFAWSLQVDDDKWLLTLASGWYAFKHTCDRGKRGVIICSPELTPGPDGHKITGTVSITITPSILCQDCGTHGYITNGKWVAA